MSNPDYALFAEIEDLGVTDHQIDEIGGDTE